MEWTIQAKSSSQAQQPTLEEAALSRIIQEKCDEAREKVLKELENVRSSDNTVYQHAEPCQDNEQCQSHPAQSQDGASRAAILTNDRLVDMTENQIHNEAANSKHEESDHGYSGTDDGLGSGNVSAVDVSSFSRHTAFVNVPCMNIAHERQGLLSALNKFHARVVQPRRQSFQRAVAQVEQMVNAVLEHVEKLDAVFKCRRVTADSSYECHSRNHIDIYVVLENIPPGSFVLEDMKTPTGFARVRLTSEIASSMTTETTSLITSATTSSMTLDTAAQVLDFTKYCTKTDSGEFYLSPKKLCRRFAALVDEASLDALDNNFFTSHHKTVSFHGEENAADAVIAFQVGLVPTIQCSNTWPSCAHWLRTCSRKWPEASVKDQVIDGGIDLVAMATARDRDELWRISFSGARRRLIRSVYNESKEKCLQILNALYEEDLSRPKALSPVHLENIVLWASKKYWSPDHWSEAFLPDRFLELLAALYRCLQNQDCYDFFVPAFNLFAQHKPRVLQLLAAKVQDVLENPHNYLQV